jgi:DNA-binding LacI/PurR family transcriptional regulator
VARSLRQKRTNVIAFYDETNLDLCHPFFAAIVAGMLAGCEQQHKDLLIHGHFHGQSDDDIFLGLLNGQIDGLVLCARSVTPLVERIIQSHLPIVTVAERIPGVPFIGIDEISGSQLLARHLEQRGYKRVLYRCPEKAMPPTIQERAQAFYKEATALGLTLLHSCSNDATPTREEQELLLSGEGQRPDAVACWSDFSADGITRFCLQHNLRIPQDIAIVGFDGLSPMDRPALRLTTIQAPWLEVSCTAVKLLVAHLEEGEVPQETILPVELVVGDTT